jgi:arylsulfatase
MYLAFNAPHFPIQADSALIAFAPPGGQSYLDMYGGGWAPVRNQRYQRMLSQGIIDSSFGLSPPEPFGTPTQRIPGWATLTAAQQADLTRKMALYAASVESVDATVGRVVARLEAEGQLDNTLIIVQSDNGGNYEGGVVGTAFGSAAPLTGQQLLSMGQPEQVDHVQVGGSWAHLQNTPFRFFKHYTHGGGVRSPLIVSWPAKMVKMGAWTNQVGHVIDLVPTILEAAQVKHPTEFAGHAVLPLEGTSLLMTITGGTPAGPRRLGFEHETNRGWIDGNFKLVVRHENADTLELYDLSTDPSELNNLALAQPARLANMVSAWNAWATRVGVPAARQLQQPDGG